MHLETLDMTGCRGDARALEKQVWTRVHANRAKTEVRDADEPTVDPRITELLEEARKLREEAAKLRQKAAELEAKADELERASER